MSKYNSDDFSDFFNTNSDANSSNNNNNHTNSRNYNYSSNISDDTYEDADDYYDDDYNASATYDDDDDDDYEDGGYSAYSQPSTIYDNKQDILNSKKTPVNPEEVKMRKKLRRSKKLGTFLTMIQLVVSIVFMVILFLARKSLSSLITIPVYIAIGVVLLILFFIALVMQSKRLLIKRLGKFISTVVIIICVAGSYFLHPLMGTELGGTAKVSSKPFVLYLSADDDFGEISEKNNGRSDTNILAVINPKTYTALLLSTPRDAYVELIGQDIPEGSYDKLTHGGRYGTGIQNEDGTWGHGYNVLMDILGNLYDVDVDHYLRLNFTGFIDLVDELGGVTIDIPQGFSTYTYGESYTFNEGIQTLTGKEALTYVRERHSFATGDMQRGKNQVAMIKALIDQALSTNTITNYSSIINSISKSFETDIDISSLVALQLQLQGEKDYDGWNMVSYSVDGSTSGGYQHCYTTDSYLSVVSLDDESVEIAKKLIDMVINGDKVTDKTAEELSGAAEE